MSERCDYCNHRAPRHDRLCPAAPIKTHEEVQHIAAYGDGCCEACGTSHRYGECPTNYVKLRAGLPSDAQARKDTPLATGCLDYFPDALAEVARTSLAGSRQHHPDAPLHWDRSKSTDEADALLRHFAQRGTFDADGIRHSAKVAWRALALLQKELEAG